MKSPNLSEVEEPARFRRRLCPRRHRRRGRCLRRAWPADSLWDRDLQGQADLLRSRLPVMEYELSAFSRRKISVVRPAGRRHARRFRRTLSRVVANAPMRAPKLLGKYRGRMPLRRRAFSEAKLYPVDLGFGLPRSQRGRPVLADAETGRRVLERVQRISKRYGTDRDDRRQCRNRSGAVTTLTERGGSAA